MTTWRVDWKHSGGKWRISRCYYESWNQAQITAAYIRKEYGVETRIVNHDNNCQPCQTNPSNRCMPL